MPILHIMGDFMDKGRELYQRMRSSDGATISMGDLLLLREQLHLLDIEAVNLLNNKKKKKEPN
ncbi:MAG TPA: hypothetical protein VJ746_12655 [Nitrospira sp.]|nr:hypothetical protein [Nitrospira sp.]